MPKLKFKRARSPSVERRDRKKKKKSKKKSKKSRHSHDDEEDKPYYRAPFIYDDDDPQVSAADDASERAWRDKLFDAMTEDQPDPFYTFYDEREEQTMDEDQYAAHIRDAMFRKRYAKEIEAEKARERARNKREKERDDAKRRLEEEIERERVRHEAMRKEQDQKKLEERVAATRTQYDQQWDELQRKIAQKSKIHKSDVPWPSLDPRRVSKHNVTRFLAAVSTKELRQVQLRYHPDKFLPRLKSAFEGKPNDWEWIREKDHEVASWLNDLWTARSS
ncbi:hypothetical protein BC940DRAFT_328579 [Gongronella butleri]|nr:hypothetical protein BC940DRAFT_328579 [Gongronella butleri]